MPSNRTKVAVAAALFLICDEENHRGKRRRRVWAKNWLRERGKYSHMNLINALRVEEPDDYKNYLRMTHDSFVELLNLIRPKIEKQQTLFRETIDAEQRLIATLRYLATGRNYEDLKFSCAISPQLLGQIIPQTCWAIYEVLRSEYLHIPSTQDEWKSVANKFKTTWQFENCLGAMDGKHVLIKQPPNSGSYYYNYKGSFSVVLFAIVDANYEFIYVHTGTNGRISDGGILRRTNFYRLLMENNLNLPDPVVIHGTEPLMPFVFIGDEAFPLMTNLMKPFPQRNLTPEKKIFNYRLSRARRVVENAFGIMANRFRVLLTPIGINVENVDAIVLACTALHNFLRRKSPSYLRPQDVDSDNFPNGTVTEGEWRQTNSNMLNLDVSRQSTTQDAKEIRNNFAQYFNGGGAVPFQNRCVQ